MHVAELHLIYLVLFTLVFTCSARPRKFYLKNNDDYLRRFLKSFASKHDEQFCPRNIEGSTIVVKDAKSKKECGPEYDLCFDNIECGPGLMCCPSGCIYKCLVSRKLKTAIATDWIEEPESLTVGGNSWLIDDEESGTPRVIDCSTSIFPGIEPMRCSSGYKCRIQMVEDTVNEIPNRGICIRDYSAGSDNTEESFFNVQIDKPESNAPCIFDGKEVHHGYHDIIGCNSCFCKDGEIYCQMQPCLKGESRRLPTA